MKMQPAHYQQLVTALQQHSEALSNAIPAYKAARLTPVRFAWDALRHTGLKPGDSTGMRTGWPVYDYCNDSHIQTALFSALKDCAINY